MIYRYNTLKPVETVVSIVTIFGPIAVTITACNGHYYKADPNYMYNYNYYESENCFGCGS